MPIRCTKVGHSLEVHGSSRKDFYTNFYHYETYKSPAMTIPSASPGAQLCRGSQGPASLSQARMRCARTPSCLLKVCSALSKEIKSTVGLAISARFSRAAEYASTR